MQQRTPPQDPYNRTGQQPPVHRFSHGGQPMRPYEKQPRITPSHDCSDCPYYKDAVRKKRRRRFSLTRNLLAVIGAASLMVLLIRYVIIPLLVYLNVLAGGV